MDPVLPFSRQALPCKSFLMVNGHQEFFVKK